MAWGRTYGLGVEAVSIPIRVDWSSMVSGKVWNALRPSRLLLFVLASCGLGTGVALNANRSIVGSTVAMMGAIVLVRLVVIATSSALDREARRRFTGVLTLTREGLELKPSDGTAEVHPWSWVLSARTNGRVVRLQLDERAGRAWVSLSRLANRGIAEQVRAQLRAAGKL